MNENDLMSRLVASKAIMDNPKFTKSNNSMNGGLPPTSLQDFDIPQARYNIPQEFLQESQPVNQPYLSSIPKENTKPVGVPSVDAIKSSKLPDEIKKLMLEHPIAQPQQQSSTTLSDDLIERASRLMRNETSNNYIPESVQPKSQQKPTQTQSSNSQIDYKLIKKMIKEAVDEALEENGLIVESSEKANEMISFKVGKHVFEGRVTKIKKLT
jgi:hypothetical protein